MRLESRYNDVWFGDAYLFWSNRWPHHNSLSMYVHYGNMLSEENPTPWNHQPVNITDDNDNGFHNLSQSH